MRPEGVVHRRVPWKHPRSPRDCLAEPPLAPQPCGREQPPDVFPDLHRWPRCNQRRAQGSVTYLRDAIFHVTTHAEPWKATCYWHGDGWVISAQLELYSDH